MEATVRSGRESSLVMNRSQLKRRPLNRGRMSFTKVVWLLEPSQSKCKVRVISSSENQERKLGAVRKVRRQEELEDHRSKTAIDPVCGMTAQPRSAAGSFERDRKSVV